MEVKESIKLDKFLDPTAIAASKNGQYIAIGNIVKITIIIHKKEILN